MEEKEAKKAYTQAEKEVLEKKIAHLKDVVKCTLEAIEKAKEERAMLDEKIKYLKMDLDDLKEGHLERIEERQSKDDKAKKYSLFRVSKPRVSECSDTEKLKVIEHHYVPYQPIQITPAINPWLTPWTVWYSGDIVVCDEAISSIDGTTNTIAIQLTNSLAKNYTPGSYEITGKVINLR